MRREPSPRTLVELLRLRSDERPDYGLFSFMDHDGTESVLTLGELDRRARGIAVRLRALAPVQSRLLLLYPPGPDLVIAIFATAYADMIAVPAYPPDPTRFQRTLPRLLAIARDARPAAVLTTRALADLALALGGDARAIDGLELTPTDEWDASSADAWRSPAPVEDAPTVIQYTSGSTRAPRGVVLTHANLLHNSAVIFDRFGSSREDYAVTWLPPYHDMGLIGGILQPLYGGFRTTLMSPATMLERPTRWLSTISRHRATIAGGPTFAYALCTRKISEADRATLDLRSWRLAFVGAEHVRAEVLDAFADSFASCGFQREAFFPCYGLAEATLLVSGGPHRTAPRTRRVRVAELESDVIVDAALDEPGARVLVSSGAVPPDHVVRVVDSALNDVTGRDRVGELWVQGPCVAAGYWARPEESEAVFAAGLPSAEGPHLRTGDLGFVSGGEVYVTGRQKDVVVVRGRKHYPQDIEWTAERAHPFLRPGGAAAVAVEMDGEERLLLVLEVHALEGLQPGDIVGAVRGRVAEEHEIAPSAIVLLAPRTLPKTSSGKVQRSACWDAFRKGTFSPLQVWREEAETEPAAPSPAGTADTGALGDWIASWLAQYLKIPSGSMDRRQPIRRLGLDSMGMVELASEIEVTLGTVLLLRDVNESTTIDDLARVISASQSATGG